MITRNIATIQEHQEIIGSRFQLAQLVMHRTKQLMKGAPICEAVGKVGSEFNPKQRSEIPVHRYPKIALEELRLGQLKWKRNLDAIEPAAKPVIEINPVVFGE